MTTDPTKNTEVSIATRSKLIVKTGFRNYDVCLNPYVGCSFGCSYCYVRFFVKDDRKEWGEFVRIRSHLNERLPKELAKGYFEIPTGKVPAIGKDGKPTGKKRTITTPLAVSDARLVIGTMTDPYQPQEKKYRLTRAALQIILRDDLPRLKKVGIFTRSPLVLNDLEIIKQLPKARVHFTITPYPDEVVRKIEPYSPKTVTRWKVIQKLKDADIRVHVNIAPVMPIISDPFIEDFAEKLAKIGVDEYFVDPMQAYKESFEAFERSCSQIDGLDWQSIKQIMLDKDKYAEWKHSYYQRWQAARRKFQEAAPDHQLPIWGDHVNHTWVNMKTGEQMDHKYYNDDAS
jgi:DNA repair photolyase